MPGGEWAGGSGIRLTSIYSDARPSNIRIRLTSIKTPNAKQVSTCREESGQAVAAATQAADAARQCRYYPPRKRKRALRATEARERGEGEITGYEPLDPRLVPTRGVRGGGINVPGGEWAGGSGSDAGRRSRAPVQVPPRQS